MLLLLVISVLAEAQNRMLDSLYNQLNKEKTDSGRVIQMNEIARVYAQFDPAKGVILAKEALAMAQKIQFFNGESKALGFLANSYNNTGNYNKAMEIFLKQLSVLEKQNDPRKLAAVLMNIAIVYTQQSDYPKALLYYLQSDSIIRVHKVTSLEKNILVNLGDIYDRLNKIDSALYYYTQSYNRALKDTSAEFLGASLIGLGNCYVKKQNNKEGLLHYQQSLGYLKTASDDDLYCEALYDIAKVFNDQKQKDSSLHYIHTMMGMAQKANFQSRMMDATSFLASYYKKYRNSDSALFYLEGLTVLKDSMNSRDKIKDFQQKSFAEEVRQAELAEQKKKEEAERYQQLQLLIIGLFIPAFFLLTLLLSRRKIHIRAIRVLGIVSLLLLFEYLTLLLHPFVVELTHHTPIFELLIFVSIAAILIPGHHRIEALLIERLTFQHRHADPDHLQIKRSKLKMKKPSE
jgi:tetratricopeptide (TPR) repeat protein